MKRHIGWLRILLLGVGGLTLSIGCTTEQGSGESGAPLLTSPSPDAVGADSDRDGLPDAWEIEHFGDLSQTRDGDFDGDGYSNYVEYGAGTDPTDPADYPAFEKNEAGTYYEYDSKGRMIKVTVVR